METKTAFDRTSAIVSDKLANLGNDSRKLCSAYGIDHAEFEQFVNDTNLAVILAVMEKVTEARAAGQEVAQGDVLQAHVHAALKMMYIVGYHMGMQR